MSDHKFEFVLLNNNDDKILKTINKFLSLEDLTDNFRNVYKRGQSSYDFIDGIVYEKKLGPPGLGILHTESRKIARLTVIDGEIMYFYIKRKKKPSLILIAGEKS